MSAIDLSLEQAQPRFYPVTTINIYHKTSNCKLECWCILDYCIFIFSHSIFWTLSLFTGPWYNNSPSLSKTDTLTHWLVAVAQWIETLNDVALAKGNIPKNKMEFFNGIFHEGGGGSRVPLFCSSICWLKTSRITLSLPKRVLVIVWALYYVSIVVEVTLNSSEYDSHRTDQPENVNFEPIIRGLKSDIFDWELAFGNVFVRVTINGKSVSGDNFSVISGQQPIQLPVEHITNLWWTNIVLSSKPQNSF